MIRHLLLALAVLLAAPALAQDGHWVASWGSSQMVPDDKQMLSADALEGATLRQVVRLSKGGDRLRVRVSNVFGTAPLKLHGVHIARSAKLGTAGIVKGTDRALTFSGRREVFVPAGAEFVSDPVALAMPALGHLAISLRFAEAPSRQTGHPGSRATSFLLAGDHLAATGMPGADARVGWFQIAGVDVEAPAAAGAIVILGDSITDGYGVPTDTDQRWPDRLAERLQADPATRRLAVINQGIGGNRILRDGSGPNALARFDRDVLAQAGVTHMILLEGVNDLGTLTRDAPVSEVEHKAEVARIIAGYTQMVARARERGIRAIGATILPYGGSEYYHPDRLNEADRQAINAWIRAPGNFDAVIDFDALARDPARPDHMRADFDSGDGLHPSMAGYRVMGDAVDLALFDDRPMIALTFDDLPVHGPLPAGETPQAVVDALLAALRSASVTEAFGFVNAASAMRDPALMHVLQSWREANYPLGNHGWSHANLNDVPTRVFTAEIVRNEAPLKRLMGARDWRWFRYLFLAEGNDPAKRIAVRKLLADRGYRIAPVSMDFSDWAWNAAYARCRARGDTRAIAAMEAGFLAAARESAAASRAMARSLYGRDIPYVLLLHVGAFDARMMPRLLAMYRDEGFRFGTLDEALRHPAYAADAIPGMPPRPAGLEGKLAEAGLGIVPRRDHRAEVERLCV
jgi:lysophospholipase L1-like esterase